MNRGFPVRALGTVFCFLTLHAGPAWSADAPLLAFQETQLTNGLRLLTLEDHACPIVSVQLWYHVGSKDEQIARQGFAHMFEHMMFRGTDRLGPTDHLNFVRKTGGECNAYTSFDQTVYFEVLPSNQLELALWLEAERMGFLKIDQTAFDTERKVVEEELRLSMNRPYGLVPKKALQEIFKVHPYSWSPIGQLSHLRSSAAQELRDFWMRYYVPNNATLVIAGDVTHAEAQKLTKRYFGWIPRDADPPRITAREPVPTKARSITIPEENAPAPGVAIIWHTVPNRHDDAVPLELLARIVGGGDSSRLYRQLVADKQLAVIAAALAFPLEQEGVWGCGAVLAPLGGDLKKVQAEMEKQIERVRTEPVSAQELLKAKNQLLYGQVRQTLTINQKATLLGSAAVLEGDASRVNRRLEQIRRATADDLLRVAKTYLGPDQSLTGKVEANLLGTIFGMRSPEVKKEEESPITAKPEKTAPPPGRPGLRRPADFPTKPPTAKALNARATMAHTRQTLPNGLKVIVVPNHAVPYVSIQLGLLSGGWTEPRPGTASLALQMLTKGTERHGEKELADELETYAINLGGSANMDTAEVTATCLTEHVERALTSLAEVVRTPTFPDKELEKLRKQVRTALAISATEPATKAERELGRRLFGAHPYARTATGELEDVSAVKVQDLRSWWQSFARPDQAVLIFAGDIETDKAMSLAKSAFGDWKAVGPKPDIQLPEIPKPQATRIFLVNHPGVQSQIRVAQLGIRRDHPEYPAARVVSDYFGGAFGSRLNEVIRVKKGLTYGARGGFQTSRFAGTLNISTFSKTESTAAAVQAVFDELERLGKEGPTTEELEATKSYFAGSFARDRETPQQVAGGLWLIESNGLADNYFEKTLENVLRVEGPACLDLVHHTVDPSKMVIVVVGDAARIQQDLEKIAPVTVVKPNQAAEK